MTPRSGAEDPFVDSPFGRHPVTIAVPRRLHQRMADQRRGEGGGAGRGRRVLRTNRLPSPWPASLVTAKGPGSPARNFGGSRHTPWTFNRELPGIGQSAHPTDPDRPLGSVLAAEIVKPGGKG